MFVKCLIKSILILLVLFCLQLIYKQFFFSINTVSTVSARNMEIKVIHVLVQIIVVGKCVSCTEPSSRACSVGQRQSPINIETKNVRYHQYRPFNFTNHHLFSIREGNLYAENTGHVLKIKAKEGHFQAVLNGGPLTVDFVFVQMHFHWGDCRRSKNSHLGSEHTIDGESFPLELHLVYRNSHDESVEKGLMHENGLTVLAFKFQRSDNPEMFINAMETIKQIARKHLRKAHSKFDKYDLPENTIAEVNLVNFLPALLDEYFFYRGSLTTGGCEEAVNWIVFKNPLGLHSSHLMAFQTLADENGKNIKNNFRIPQPTNGRPVYYHGIDLIKRKIISLGSAGGTTRKYEDYVIKLPCDHSYRNLPLLAAMAKAKDRQQYEELWRSSPSMANCI